MMTDSGCGLDTIFLSVLGWYVEDSGSRFSAFSAGIRQRRWVLM